jgi:hypothetical protein
MAAAVERPEMEPTGRGRLWNDPDGTVAAPMRETFDLLQTIVEESHWWRYILGCRCCGQKYFFEFYEEIDWTDGEDPQFSVWVPFATEAELATLKATPPGVMGQFIPRLCKDYPKGAKQPRLYWIRRGTG